MILFYRLIQRVYPRQKDGPRKWHAKPVHKGKITLDMLSADIEKRTSLSRGDVANVILTLVSLLPKYLMMGCSVSMGELGTFRPSFSSKGVDKPEDFDTGMISGQRIIFTPGVGIKKALKQIRFRRERGVSGKPGDE